MSASPGHWQDGRGQVDRRGTLPQRSRFITKDQLPEQKHGERQEELYSSVSKLQKQRELSGGKQEGVDFQLEHQDRVLEREVFNVDGLQLSLIHI